MQRLRKYTNSNALREKKEVINMCDGDCEIGDNLEVIE